MSFWERLRLAWRVLRYGEAACAVSPMPGGAFHTVNIVRTERHIQRLSSSWDCRPEMIEQAKQMIAAELGHSAADCIVFDVSCNLEDAYYHVRGDLLVALPEGVAEA